MNMRPVVVYAPPYNEDKGGAIVLHLLVDKLRAYGINAYVRIYRHNNNIFNTDPYVGSLSLVPSFIRKIWFVKFSLNILLRLRTNLVSSVKINTNDKKLVSGYLDTPIATYKELRQAIVVYPESFNGNLLRSKRVVRWLLHSPGFINKNVDFDKAEELFYYQEAFKGEYVLSPDRRLYVFMCRHDCYYPPEKSTVRKDKCYIIRKGRYYGLSAQKFREEDKTVVDGLSHAEIGEIFRKYKYLISYDTNTFYTDYAVLCGCVPVILKPPMMPEEEFSLLCGEPRPGIAFGYDDIERAVNTREDLLRRIQENEKRQDSDIKNFIEFIKKKYPL